jgi:hypothetical protein
MITWKEWDSKRQAHIQIGKLSVRSPRTGVINTRPCQFVSCGHLTDLSAVTESNPDN